MFTENRLMPGLSPKRLLAPGELSELLGGLFSEAVYVDAESADRLVINRVDCVHASTTTGFQRVDIFRSPHFGLVLALDGIVQVAESDEQIYHELLIHPACLMIPTIRSALVLGGGDGCAARELLKYKELEIIEVVEIDRKVVELCRKHFDHINAGALDDPRVRVNVAEGESYLREHPEKRYDLIVADLTEPYDIAGRAGELSRHIFSPAFYNFLRDRMSPFGILVLQTGGIAYIPEVDRHHKTIIQGLRSSFQAVHTAYEYIHSFDQLWTITLASDHPYDVPDFDPDPILENKGVSRLKHYDTVSHQRAFRTPKHLRDLFRE